MISSLQEIFGSVVSSFTRLAPSLWNSTLETLYMVSFSTFFSFIIGFFLAVFMIITGPHGINPRASVYTVLENVVDILRSLPFIILIIAMIPITKLVMGKSIGTTAVIFPLTVAAAPFAARLLEANFLEVDKGVVEAAKSFGASTRQIIFKVMLPEALPGIVLNIAVLGIALLGYSAMAGTVGGGGLGDLAYRLGYSRFQADAMIWCIIILILIVKCVQGVGNFFYRKLR